jgi:hypothetical protein
VKLFFPNLFLINLIPITLTKPTMKNTTLLLLLLSNVPFFYGQFTTSWPNAGASNSQQSGYIGIGTKPTSTNSVQLPEFNLQLHGTSDFLESITVQSSSFSSSIPQIIQGEMDDSFVSPTKSTTNHGKTTRFGMTNTTTGAGINDGVVFRMSENNFSLINREQGNITIAAPGVGLTFSSATKRIWTGGSSVSTSSIYAAVNLIKSNDNGLYVQGGNGKYGLRVKTVNNTEDALQVYGSNSSIKNFKVSGGGEVFARKYTTTFNNIPDYVFEPNYMLLSFADLRNYIVTNKHLPNIPSANQFAETGVDLGELNRLLLEKVEELTLYMLQLEDRLNAVESSK